MHESKSHSKYSLDQWFKGKLRMTGFRLHRQETVVLKFEVLETVLKPHFWGLPPH